MTCVHSKKCLVFAIICFLLVGTDEFSYSISMLSMFSMSYISIDAGFTDFTFRFGGRFCEEFCSQELLDSPNVSFPRMRRRTPGVDALREEALAFWWSGRIRPEEKKKRNGSDWMAIQKKYIEGNCVQVEMS